MSMVDVTIAPNSHQDVTMIKGGNDMGRDMVKRAKWEKDNLRSYTFKVHKVTDKDICKQLDKQPNKRAYIIDLIRKDIKK